MDAPCIRGTTFTWDIDVPYSTLKLSQGVSDPMQSNTPRRAVVNERRDQVPFVHDLSGFDRV